MLTLRCRNGGRTGLYQASDHGARETEKQNGLTKFQSGINMIGDA
jgi:hypothetical protein